MNVIEMPGSTADSANGVFLHYRGNVGIYSLYTTDSAPIDAWIQSIVHELHKYSPEQHFQVIYDFSHISLLRLSTFRFYDVGTLGLTLAGNQEVLKVLKERPELMVSLGVVLDASLSAKVAKATANKLTHYERRFFFNVDNAYQWLTHK